MKYYGYYRVSTATQTEKYGMDTQKDGIEEYAKKNGIEIAEYFCDPGISGTVFDRPGLTDLLATMDTGDRVIVLNTSRLWRDDMTRCAITYTLKKIHADVISIEQPEYSINTTDPTAWLTNAILEALDVYSRLEINMKLSKGRKSKARSGSKACGTAPIGYQWTAERTIEPDPDTAPMIVDIFNAYEELQSLSKLAAYCDEMDYRTQRGGSFSKASLAHILKNTFYVGSVTHAGEVYDGTHEPIIDPQTFENVNDILTRNNLNQAA